MDLIGKVLSDRYEILEEIGVGGMAYVYKAKCRLLNRNVAVKVLKEEYSKDEMFVKRFKTEAQSAASLTHPNIVSVYDVGEENGVNYIVMELLEGKTLKEYITEHGSLSNEETIRLSIQIVSALDAAHKEHIIHRDIKPQNIVLGKNNIAKVTDFGIAKMASTATITNFGTTMGSVHYFSPEHAKGGYTDEKSDIYSLGVVMYEMATGKVPFDSDSSVSVALKHIQETPVSPNIVKSEIWDYLNNVILKAMAKNTVNRYKTAADLLEDLNEALVQGKSSKIASVEAGFTQVIPTLDQEIVPDSYVVPNLRTRSSRNMTVVKAVSRKENIENKEQEQEPILEKKNSTTSTKKTILIVSIVAVVILIIISGIFIFNLVKKMKENNKPTQTYVIPNLIDRNFEEVKAEYEKQGFVLEIDKTEYHATIKEGNVISQTPGKGESSTSNKIYVVVSKGVKMIGVPDVTGKDIKVVKYELEDTLGFVIETEEVVNDKVLAGIVISQEPLKNTEAPYGSTIKLKVSKGDGKIRVIMPSVLGKTQADAKKILTDLKLTVKVKYSEDKNKGNGTVLEQSYPQNKELVEGDLVEITVNRLSKSKTITLDLKTLIGETEKEHVTVKVMASIDGSAENAVFEKTVDKTETTATFTVNGYTTVKYRVLIDGKDVKTETVNL